MRECFLLLLLLLLLLRLLEHPRRKSVNADDDRRWRASERFKSTGMVNKGAVVLRLRDPASWPQGRVHAT